MLCSVLTEVLFKTKGVQLCVWILFWQPPLGNGDDGRHAEIPKPHEPQRGGSRCPGQTRGPRWEAAQPQAAQHRVGNTLHRQICAYCVAALKGMLEGGGAHEPGVVIEVYNFIT